MGRLTFIFSIVLFIAVSCIYRPDQIPYLMPDGPSEPRVCLDKDEKELYPSQFTFQVNGGHIPSRNEFSTLENSFPIGIIKYKILKKENEEKCVEKTSRQDFLQKFVAYPAFPLVFHLNLSPGPSELVFKMKFGPIDAGVLKCKFHQDQLALSFFPSAKFLKLYPLQLSSIARLQKNSFGEWESHFTQDTIVTANKKEVVTWYRLNRSTPKMVFFKSRIKNNSLQEEWSENISWFPEHTLDAPGLFWTLFSMPNFGWKDLTVSKSSRFVKIYKNLYLLSLSSKKNEQNFCFQLQLNQWLKKENHFNIEICPQRSFSISLPVLGKITGLL